MKGDEQKYDSLADKNDFIVKPRSTKILIPTKGVQIHESFLQINLSKAYFGHKIKNNKF